ncbi:MAG: universal stress protein [Candidatus Hadarchaeales archaeon]
MFKKMVVCVTEATSSEVIKIASKLSTKKTEVYLLHVVRVLNEFARKKSEELFSPFLKFLKKNHINAKLELVESVDPKKAIVTFAKKNMCDVIISGTIPRKGLVGYLSESVTDYLVRNAPCTVILVRKPQEPR